MELIIAFLLSFFAYKADLATHQSELGVADGSMQINSGARPDPGRIDGPIIVVDDTHFKPPKTY
jgi:hypothetical protein